MPDRLTGGTPRGAVLQVVVVLAAFAVVGALAGVVWEWVWTPPDGVAVEGEWVRDEAGLRGEFSGTGWYVVIASVAGILAGVMAGVVFDRHELLTLAAVTIGSCVAAWLMLRVGHALGPPDPQPLAESAEDLTRIPGPLEVRGRSPWVAFPGGALAGLVVVFVGLSRRREFRD